MKRQGGQARVARWREVGWERYSCHVFALFFGPFDTLGMGVLFDVFGAVAADILIYPKQQILS